MHHSVCGSHIKFYNFILFYFFTLVKIRFDPLSLDWYQSKRIPFFFWEEDTLYKATKWQRQATGRFLVDFTFLCYVCNLHI